MRHHFVTCDVFTDVRFGGNPLAVLPDARGLATAQMQRIAREFNYSETTFVMPAERGGTRRVRIFTPAREVPFAGHPNVGTAFVLATTGELGEIVGPTTVVFEELAGDVPVEVVPIGDGRFSCELRAPEDLSVGQALPVDLIADALCLSVADIEAINHPPLMASVGLPFVVVELADLDALRRARPDTAALGALLAAGAETADVHVYVRVPDAQDGVDVRARMFAPFDGVPEDPATGSANCALAGVLAHLDERSDVDLRWRIAQGVEMGRPSVLDARAAKRAGAVSGTWIGGESVLVSEGTLEV
jgi:trans-2,3-dihydro-3-hydroxyanthranilate isomerase